MTLEGQALPRYRRVSHPPSMQLTERDKAILEAIHSYDGLLGFSQIQRMFFSGESQTERRMMLLYQNRYVNRPGYEERKRLPVMIYWLDKRGAGLVARIVARCFDRAQSILAVVPHNVGTAGRGAAVREFNAI